FFVSCESVEEITDKWQKLSEGGTVRMGLDKYPFAERYGWTTDKFGVEWQLILQPKKQKIVPAFLFTNENFGRGKEAVDFYLSLFPNSKLEAMSFQQDGKAVLHAAFEIAGQGFVLMEGPGVHGASQNGATSIVVGCDTQAEIDKFWSELSADGGSTSQCGWLSDKFGTPWQIVPNKMGEWMKEPERAKRVMSAMFKMTKLDIEILKNA
ncbi:MAG: VOC family protein, partial [Bdellovibrionota bacterium]